MYAGMYVRSGKIIGKVIYVLDNESLVEYRTRTVYGMVTVREWFWNSNLAAT